MNHFSPKNMLLAFALLISSMLMVNAQTPVAKYGQLQIKNGKVSDKNGNPVVLRGMSLFWSGWKAGADFYKPETVKWLREDWCVDIIRIPMAVDAGDPGKTYNSNPTYAYNQVKTVIDACIANGLYVIVDFHTHNVHLDAAKKFFTDIATEYGSKPNILYETFNEPVKQDWNSVIKPYHNEVIAAIRKIDTKNIIICGTKNWSQDVDEAANDPVTGTNIAYTLHYYADSHKDYYRQKATAALKKGVALFVTEYGTCNANGAGDINATESQKWWDFLEQNQIGSCNWSVTNKDETSAAIAGTTAKSGWTENQLTASGKLVRNYIKSKCDSTPTGGATGISDLIENKIEIYPNPVSNNLNVNISKLSGNKSVKIVDMMGRVITEQSNEDMISVDMNDLPQGMYLIQVQTESGNVVKSVIKK